MLKHNKVDETNSKTNSAPDDASVEKNESTRRHRVKHPFLVVFVSIVTLVIVVPLLIAGWMGFVPGLSNILGSRTPKDLGVTWTAADLTSYKAKTGTNFLDFVNAPANPDKPGKKTIFSDPKTVTNLVLTQAEITAAINSLGWELAPLTNVQVRLTPGTMEVSGNVKLDRVVDFVNFIGGVGYSSSDVQKAVNAGKSFVNGAAFYAKARASVTDNVLGFTLENVQIGRYAPPLDVATKVISTGGSNGLHNTKYLDVQSATIGQGTLSFSGTYPTTMYVKH